MSKYFKETKEMKQDWTEAENFDICVCVIFDRYCLF